MKRFLFVIALAAFAGVAHAATVAHWNFEPAAGYPANKAYDWSNGGWMLDIGPSGQISADGKFGNCLKNIGGVSAAPGSVAKCTNNYFTPSQGIKGSPLESVFAGPQWTVELFVRFDAQPTVAPAHIFYTGNTQLDFAAGFIDVMGIYWDLSNGSIHYLQQRTGTNTCINHFRPSSTVDQMAITDGQWHHLAHSLRAGRDYIYFDGTLIDSDPYSGDGSDGYEASGNPMVSVLTSVQSVGTPFGEPLVGSVDEIRISDVSLYVSSFTPPDQPFPTPTPIPTGQTPTPTPTPSPSPTPYALQIVAAYNFDVAPGSTTIPDLSGNGFDLTVGTAGAIETGGVSGNCIRNTAGQNESAAAQVAFRTGLDDTLLDTVMAGSYTVEFWIRQDDSSQRGDDWTSMFWIGNATNYALAFCMLHRGDTPGMAIYPFTGGRLQCGAQPLTDGQWVHYAACMNELGDVTGFFFDGTTGTRVGRFQGVGLNPAGFSPTDNARMDLLAPNIAGASWIFPGSIDDLRIVRGVVYTGETYTPPANVLELPGGPTPTPTPGVVEMIEQFSVSDIKLIYNTAEPATETIQQCDFEPTITNVGWGGFYAGGSGRQIKMDNTRAGNSTEWVSSDGHAGDMNFYDSDQSIGSYIYTPQLKQSIDLSGSGSKIEWDANGSFTEPQTATIRIMLKTAANGWIISNGITGNLLSRTGTIWTPAPGPPVFSAEVSSLTWSAISNATATPSPDLDGTDNGLANDAGPLTIGSAVASPNLSQVTGFGLYLASSLAATNDLDIDGIRLTGMVELPNAAPLWMLAE
jgi:hypothetical protein